VGVARRAHLVDWLEEQREKKGKASEEDEVVSTSKLTPAPSSSLSSPLTAAVGLLELSPYFAILTLPSPATIIAPALTHRAARPLHHRPHFAPLLDSTPQGATFGFVEDDGTLERMG
jgi:hypothetical protein